MSGFLDARRLAHQAGGVQGRDATLSRLLGVYSAPTLNGPDWRRVEEQRRHDESMLQKRAAAAYDPERLQRELDYKRETFGQKLAQDKELAGQRLGAQIASGEKRHEQTLATGAARDAARLAGQKDLDAIRHQYRVDEMGVRHDYWVDQAGQMHEFRLAEGSARDDRSDARQGGRLEAQAAQAEANRQARREAQERTLAAQRGNHADRQADKTHQRYAAGFAADVVPRSLRDLNPGADVSTDEEAQNYSDLLSQARESGDMEQVGAFKKREDELRLQEEKGAEAERKARLAERGMKAREGALDIRREAQKAREEVARTAPGLKAEEKERALRARALAQYESLRSNFMNADDFAATLKAQGVPDSAAGYADWFIEQSRPAPVTPLTPTTPSKFGGAGATFPPGGAPGAGAEPGPSLPPGAAPGGRPGAGGAMAMAQHRSPEEEAEYRAEEDAFNKRNGAPFHGKYFDTLEYRYGTPEQEAERAAEAEAFRNRKGSAFHGKHIDTMEYRYGVDDVGGGIVPMSGGGPTQTAVQRLRNKPVGERRAALLQLREFPEEFERLGVDVKRVIAELGGE